MITAIARLGYALREESEVEALVDHSNAKTVLVLKFATSRGSTKYAGIDVEEKREDGLYLYRRDVAGRGPGLFLTGRISRFDLQTLQRNLRLLKKDPSSKKARESVEDFLKKKLDWLPRGGIVSNIELLSTLSRGGRATLDSLLDEVKNRSKQIHADFLSKIDTFEPEELFTTVKIVRGPQEYYVGQVPEYVALFRSAVTRVKERRKTKETLLAPACTICNKPGVTAKFSQPPLPFVTTDKPGFIPQGDRDQAHKVFPLCSDCFLDLRRGWRFIERYLEFSVSSVDGKRSEVRFWLIPVLNDPAPFMELIRRLDTSQNEDKGRDSSRFLYLRNLKTMCSTMNLITALASESDLSAEESLLEAFLTFTALFFAKDRKGHMRLISRSEGIYPKRLKFVVKVKRRVDSLYPFEREGIHFGFPLLREFLAPARKSRVKMPEGWYKDLASILGNVLTGMPVNKSLVYKAVAGRIQEEAKEGDLGRTGEVSYKGLSVIQYLEHLESFERKGDYL